jgi:selenocysteine-specific elongation factor
MKHIVVGTAGHIDHGKSALVQALTGTDPDRLKEEKARGITIDLGFAHWDAPGLSVAFVDVPGHERFVKNMLAGVGGLDAVMLIVAADESVMPQTREHFEICRLLHVPAGLIVITKADLVDEELIDLVRIETRELVQGSFLADAPVVAVSARSGHGLDELRAGIELLGRAVMGRPAAGPARLPIDRVFSMKGFGTVVTGTLVSGRIGVEDGAVVLPGERAAKIRGIQVHGAKQLRAVAGQRVAVNLGGVEVADLERGQSLVAPGAFVPTRVVDARIESLETAKPLRHGARVRFHQGTSEVLGRVALSSLVADDARGADDPAVAAEVPPGRFAYARVRLEAPVVITRGDRFIVRAYSPPLTIGGGEVLDPQPPRGGIRTAAGRDRFRELDAATAADRGTADERALLLLVREGASAGLPLTALTSRLGLSNETRRPSARLEDAGRLTRVGSVLIDVPLLASLAEAVLAIVGEYHRASPLIEGIPREEVRERVCAHAAPGVFERVIDDLVAAGRISATDRLALVTHRADVNGADAIARERIVARYRDGGLKPPQSGEVAAALGLGADIVNKIVALLVRQRTLLRVDTLVFHEAALRQLKDDVRSLKAERPGVPVTIDVAAFKERYGMTRKFAIPLLEYLDRERVTRRVGDARVVI